MNNILYSTPFVPLLLALLCAVICVLLIGMLRVRASQTTKSEDWRDRAPIFFRLVRVMVSLFVERVESTMKRYRLEVVQEKLEMAGLGYSIRASEFIVARRISLVIGLFIFIVLFFSLDNTQTWAIWMLALAATFIPLGFFFPDIWLRDKIKQRQLVIEKQFPFFLELQVLTMRAGLNFTSAISHSVDRMPKGPVKDEFDRLLREIRTGRSRRDALVQMARRVKMPALTNYVATINQAEETGGELGDVLVSQANQRRAERFLRAEKLANQAPVKMLAPLLICLFPSTLVVIFAPLAIEAWHNGALDFFLN